MKKRYKLITVRARVFVSYCPYKDCAHEITLYAAAKEQIVRCENCRKELKIKKVVCK